MLGYTRETFARETVISATAPAKIDEDGLTFEVTIPPHGEWTTELDVDDRVRRPGGDAAESRPARARRPNMAARPRPVARATRRGSSATRTPLQATYHRSLVDLAALRFSPARCRGARLPAAGLPWFMTMFGRDSIFTSLQALPFTPELAATTLRALGERQGTRVDDFRDEDPGRILHEMRYGEMTAFEERPHSPYYGCADATPLFVVLLDEYERWTGDTKLVRDLEHEARAALNWIDEYADLQGNGYICVPAPQREDRPREPVLEGLVGLDLLPRRHAARLPARDLRAAGLRLRREDARRPPRAARLEGPGVRRPAREGGRRPEAPLQPRLLGRGRRVLRARARRRRPPGRLAHLEQRPPALERHRRQVEGEVGRRAPDGASGCSPAGACARWPRARAATTRSATTSARSGRSTTRSSPGACAATASRRRRRGSLPGSSTRPSSSTAGCPRRSAATRAS